MLADIDRLKENRSKFVLEAVRQELERRREILYRKPLDNPHPESQEFEASGFDVWAKGLPDEDAAPAFNSVPFFFLQVKKADFRFFPRSFARASARGAGCRFP